MTAKKLTTNEKAQAVNSDPSRYGSFAEIGAGQEVARWFFRAGRASQTVAKTMSAYDMTFSDSIYGAEKNHRYVCDSRLQKMLKKEFGLLQERLGEKRGETTRFFAFADTVASKKADRLMGGHGWLGVRFQHKPLAEHSDVVIHIRMLDRNILTQQEAVGLVGVNLIYGCLFLQEDPIQMIDSLKDHLKHYCVEIDMIRVSGPAFEGVDNRLLAVHLVELGMTDAVLFSPKGEVLQPSDALYGRPIMIQRGRFRPITNLHIDMFEQAKRQLLRSEKVDESKLIPLMEITINNLLSDGNVDISDFLARVDLLSGLGYHVMVSNYAEYHRLSDFLLKYTREKVGIVMGVGHLGKIFDEKYYEELPGGLLTALGSLFPKNVKALVYPAHSLSTSMPSPEDPGKRQLITAENFEPSSTIEHIYQHMLAKHHIEDIKEYDEKMLQINSEAILNQIRTGESGWESSLPKSVARAISQKGLFGYQKAKKSA